MAKALRVFIVLLLLLSVASLVFGILLFLQKEQLKGRTQKLENTVMQVAEKMTAARDPYIKTMDQRIDRTALMVYTNMDVQLQTLVKMTENRYEELYNTYNDLKLTRDDLEATRQELAQTRQELQAARDQIAQLEQRLEEKEAELAQANAKITDLEGQIAAKEQEIDSLNATIAKMKDEKKVMDDRIIFLEQELLALGWSPTGGKRPEGLAGQILIIDPNWSFVVLNVGSREGAGIGTEMAIHRDNEVLGRVRISGLREHMCIAEILRDLTPSVQNIKEGDRVLVVK